MVDELLQVRLLVHMLTATFALLEKRIADGISAGWVACQFA
jgi:hypothetical protein